MICAYTPRRLGVLQAAVSATVEQLSAVDDLVLVVDHNPELLAYLTGQAPDPGTGQFADALPVDPALTDPRVRVIANGNEKGLSGARNAGVAVAGGEIVAFLDDDAVPRADWLDRLIEPFADPEIIGAGGVALPAWEVDAPGWLPDEFLWVVGCSYKGLPERQTEIRNPIGANMAFRLAVLRQIEGFTHGIGRVGRTPLGCEETELSIRACRATGGKIVQQPSAAVDHLVTADRLDPRYFVHRCWAEGISKAIVSRLAGRDAALESERDYATRTLPTGAAVALRDGFTGQRAAFGRLLAIVAGLAVAVAGYLRGSASRLQPGTGAPAMRSGSALGAFVPVWSGQLDLAAPSLPKQIADADGCPFERARLLIRRSGTPLGFLDIETPRGETLIDDVVTLARERFAAEASRAAEDERWRSDSDHTVTTILCTHNRVDGARRTLESLQAVQHPKLEIVVVDNAPSDEATLELVRELQAQDPRIRYVREPRKGLSRARNRGLREATGEYVAFTDDDVTVDPLWVKGLLRGFGRSAEVGCVTGLVASSSLARPAELYFDQRVWWSSSCEPRTYTGGRDPRDSPLHPYTAGRFGTGANFAARATDLRALGGFDQCLGAGSPTQGGEDLDIFVRFITSGHAIAYEPSALVWHEHRIDDASLRAQMYAYGLGLTAYLTKYLLAPGSRAEIVRRAFGGLLHSGRLLRRSRSAGEQAALDGGMTRVELRGMLGGPAAYLRARRAEDPAHLRAVAP